MMNVTFRCALMAYLIFADRDGETLRLPLSADRATTVGRAHDNDAPLHDALLSRNHCRVEPLGDHFVFVDLNSRNGSFLGKEKLTRHVLADGEVIRFGRSRMCFRESDFVSAPKSDPIRAGLRPADPFEALAGTVIGFALEELTDEEEARIADLPRPQPRPPEPRSCSRGLARSLVFNLTIKSWDSGTKTTRSAKRATETLPRHVDETSRSLLAPMRSPMRSLPSRRSAAAAMIAVIVVVATCVSIMLAAR